jgi:hypothetical protein
MMPGSVDDVVQAADAASAENETFRVAALRFLCCADQSSGRLDCLDP